MASMDFSSTSLDVKYLQSLFASAGGSKPPGLKPGQRPIKTDDGAGDHINMPSENPISIPGLPAGWKFGDVMPQGTPRPSDEPEEEDQKNLLPLDIATSRKRKRRPEQPVIFQVWTVPSFSPSLSRFRCIFNRDHMVALMSLTTVFRRTRLVHWPIRPSSLPKRRFSKRIWCRSNRALITDSRKPLRQALLLWSRRRQNLPQSTSTNRFVLSIYIFKIKRFFSPISTGLIHLALKWVATSPPVPTSTERIKSLICNRANTETSITDTKVAACPAVDIDNRGFRPGVFLPGRVFILAFYLSPGRTGFYWTKTRPDPIIPFCASFFF